MYQINVSTRRVTQFIIEEAYKWLYKRILDGEYSVNRSKKAKALFLQIEEERLVTKESYNDFIEMFENSPINYMLYRSKRKSCKRITTDILLNYFVEYNGSILPIGFIKDFFEDDYETRQEVNALLEEFGKANKSEMGILWRRNLITKEDEIDSLRSHHANVLKIHPMLLIIQIIQLVITGGLIYVFSAFQKYINLFETIKIWVTQLKLQVYDNIIASETLMKFGPDGEVFCHAGKMFTFVEYISEYALFIALGIILLLVLIVRIKNLLGFVFFLVRTIVINIRLSCQKMFIHRFEKKGMESIIGYFDKKIPDIVESGVIDNSHCAEIPVESKIYNYINSFNAQKFTEKLYKSSAKYMKKKYVCEQSDLPLVKSTWRKKLGTSIFFGLLFSVLLHPELFKLVAPKVASIWEWVIEVINS